MLGITGDQRVFELTSLFFPVRDDLIHVLHKTLFDWLTGEIDAASGVKARSEVFCVDRAAGHARAARACAGALVRKLDAAVSELGETSAASDAAAARALRALGSDSEAPFE